MKEILSSVPHQSGNAVVRKYGRDFSLNPLRLEKEVRRVFLHFFPNASPQIFEGIFSFFNPPSELTRIYTLSPPLLYFRGKMSSR